MKNPHNFIQAKQAHKVLVALHPDLFSLEKPVPLKIGINADIAQRFPDLPPYVRNTMLFWLTIRRAYLRACTDGAPRYGFDGPDGIVTAPQALLAAQKAASRDQAEISRLQRRLDAARHG